MKKLIALLVALFLCVPALAQNSNDFQIYQWRQPPTGYDSKTVAVPQSGSHGIYYFNFLTKRFRFAQLPAGWDIVSDQLTIPTQPLSAFTNDVGFITGADVRLSDARTPLAHTHDAADVVTGTLDSERIPPLMISKITGNGYSGTAIKNGLFQINKAAVVTSGVAVFHLTSDGNSTGSALCSEVQQNSVQVIVNNPNASYQYGWEFSNGDKTITVTANKFTAADISTGILGQAAANGDTVYLTVSCI